MLIDGSGRIWAMRRDEMMMAEAVAMREKMRAEAAAMGQALDGSDFAYRRGATAVVPVRGMLLRQSSYWFWSYEEILRDVALAQAHPDVTRVVLDIDSPGGLVAGCEDAARAIRASGPKPVSAFVGGMAASAAYWLATAADEIVVGSGAMLGSVGAVIEYVDMEPMLEAMGARVIRVVAQQSPNKRLDPESAEGLAEMQAMVDAAGAAFVAGVAEFRGLTEDEVLARFGQGLVFDGDAALARGMADRRGTLDTHIAELAGRDDPNAVPAPAATETSMDWNDLTLAGLREHRADLADEIAAEAAANAAAAQTDAIEEAVAAERARIAALDEVAVPGHEDLLAKARSEGWDAGALAAAIVKAEKASGAGHLKALAKADAGVPPVPPPADPGPAASDDPEAAWEADPALRAEFGNKAAWLSYAKATGAGRARVLSRNT